MRPSDAPAAALAAVLTVLVTLVAGAALLPAPAATAAAAGLRVVLEAPSDVAADSVATVVATVTDASGAPVAGHPLTLAQARPDGSTVQHPGSTDGAGRAAWPVTVAAGTHTFTAVADGDPQAPASATVTAHKDAVQLAVSADPPAWGQARAPVRIAVTRTPYGGGPAPWPGATVVWQRLTADGWVHAGSAAADAQGTVTTRVRPGRLRALVAETAGTAPGVAEARVPGVPQVTVRLRAPSRARAGTRVRLRVTTEGTGRTRATVVLQARSSGRWKRVRRKTTRGNVVFHHRPAYDVRYRARVVVRHQKRKRRFTSPVSRVRLTPTVAPFRPPAGAPAPRRRVPAQPRATQPGPAPVIRPIGDRVWRSMVGRSWRPGCPVGRRDLRLLRINYYGFDGYRHRGEIVAHRSAVGTMAGALSRLHRHKVRIRSMYRVDRFGWSARLGGADDYASMAAGNTSAFNCRGVVGRPGRRSPHSWGRSLDLNPWENPYYSPADGWVPNAWYRSHTAGRQTWRSRDALVVRLMRSAGMRWSYGVLDSHHFDG